jgi:hypothetical protein
MGRELTVDSEREERRNQILLAYVEALEAGREPDRCQLRAEDPEIASVLIGGVVGSLLAP